MEQYIDKSALVAEIERLSDIISQGMFTDESRLGIEYFKERVLSFLDTLEVKDPYEQCVQYPSIKDGIEGHAKTYSFNIESQLFPQLTKEQQTLWKKEIEQACISGGEAGVELAKDPRYKENFEVKEVDLEKETLALWSLNQKSVDSLFIPMNYNGLRGIAKHFFELGLKAQKGE